MEIVRLEGMNRDLGAPKDWDEEKHGKCEPLPVFAEVVKGNMVMTSAWKPDAEELAAINAGGPIALVIYGGVHPPCGLGVFPPPDGVEVTLPASEDCPILALAPAEYNEWEKRIWRRGVCDLETRRDVVEAVRKSQDAAFYAQNNVTHYEGREAIPAKTEQLTIRVDGSALSGFVKRMVAAVQGAVNELRPPQHINETKAEYWKAGARAAIQAVDKAIQGVPVEDPDENATS
jgi:hypothetical protein